MTALRFCLLDTLKVKVGQEMQHVAQIQQNVSACAGQLDQCVLELASEDMKTTCLTVYQNFV